MTIESAESIGRVLCALSRTVALVGRRAKFRNWDLRRRRQLNRSSEESPAGLPVVAMHVSSVVPSLRRRHWRR